MKNKTCLILLLSFLGIQGVEAQMPAAPELKTIYVADEKMKCEVNNTFMACYKIKPHKDSTWRAFTGDITDFIWEPGVQTLIEVEEYRSANVETGAVDVKLKYIRTLEERVMVLRQVDILEDNKWKLINIQIHRDMMPFARKAAAYIVFNTDSNYAQGFSGCNQFSTGASYKDGIINFFKQESTLKSCSNDSIEKLILHTLTGETQFYFKNNILQIAGPDFVTLHFRPEKRIDSLVNVLQIPRISKGNTFKKLPDNNYNLILDDVKEAGFRLFLFKPEKLSETEKKTLQNKLVNVNPDDNIQSVLIKKAVGSKKGHYKAVVIMKNGQRLDIEIRNAN